MVIILVLSFLVNHYYAVGSNLTEEQYIEKTLTDQGFPKALASNNFRPQPGQFYQPIKNFYKNQTVNVYGTYVTSGRFNGFHTGVDIEVDPADLNQDVPVYAFYDGVVELAEFASGYGGVVAIWHQIGPQKYLGVYGHLRLKGVKVRSGQKVYSGDLIGYLGTSLSSETDGERKHLHFDLHKGAVVDIRGYVNAQRELSAWANPDVLLKDLGAQSIN